MFLSAVRSRSKPTRSASASKSPLLSVSHPQSFAFMTVWPARNLAIPAGVTWSNRMRIHRGLRSGNGDRVKAARGKFQYRLDLFARNIELFDYFLDAGPGLEV